MTTAADYAKARGVSLEPARGVQPSCWKRTAPEIDITEHTRIRANVDAVKKHLPEFWLVIKELHAAGMIDGLRNITRVDLINQKEA